MRRVILIALTVALVGCVPQETECPDADENYYFLRLDAIARDLGRFLVEFTETDDVNTLDKVQEIIDTYDRVEVPESAVHIHAEFSEGLRLLAQSIQAARVAIERQDPSAMLEADRLINESMPSIRKVGDLKLAFCD